jgi:hypothetical protein
MRNGASRTKRRFLCFRFEIRTQRRIYFPTLEFMKGNIRAVSEVIISRKRIPETVRRENLEMQTMEVGHLTSRSVLAASLRISFSEGIAWPADRASLAALIDLGLSNRQIAEYFAVGQDDVRTLRDRYGF